MFGRRKVLAVLIIACALFGLAFGSFLNVVIYRVPRHESIVSPRSRCPKCATPLLERDNIPLLSWIVLRGRCRQCREPISPRYPTIEAATSALFAGCAARLGFNWSLPATLIFVTALLALASIDLELMILPKTIVYTSLFLVMGLFALDAGVTNEWGHFLSGAACALGWFALFYFINAISPRALGFGDVRLALLLGFELGWFGWRYALLGFFTSNVLGAVVGTVLLATKRLRREQPVPFGVFLAMGSAVALFAGPEILAPISLLH
jgi:leader peptidase (prepilin peptidase)/N-methyltransferase